MINARLWRRHRPSPQHTHSWMQRKKPTKQDHTPSHWWILLCYQENPLILKHLLWSRLLLVSICCWKGDRKPPCAVLSAHHPNRLLRFTIPAETKEPNESTEIATEEDKEEKKKWLHYMLFWHRLERKKRKNLTYINRGLCWYANLFFFFRVPWLSAAIVMLWLWVMTRIRTKSLLTTLDILILRLYLIADLLSKIILATNAPSFLLFQRLRPICPYPPFIFPFAFIDIQILQTTQLLYRTDERLGYISSL